MSTSYYPTAMFDNCVPRQQLSSCSMTRPFLSLRRVWFVRLVYYYLRNITILSSSTPDVQHSKSAIFVLLWSLHLYTKPCQGLWKQKWCTLLRPCWVIKKESHRDCLTTTLLVREVILTSDLPCVCKRMFGNKRLLSAFTLEQHTGLI